MPSVRGESEARRAIRRHALRGIEVHLRGLGNCRPREFAELPDEDFISPEVWWEGRGKTIATEYAETLDAGGLDALADLHWRIFDSARADTIGERVEVFGKVISATCDWFVAARNNSFLRVPDAALKRLRAHVDSLRRPASEERDATRRAELEIVLADADQELEARRRFEKARLDFRRRTVKPGSPPKPGMPLADEVDEILASLPGPPSASERRRLIRPLLRSVLGVEIDDETLRNRLRDRERRR